MINRREAFKKIGQGIAAVAGFSLITPPKKGMSDLITHYNLDLQYAKLPIHLTVVESLNHYGQYLWVQPKDREGYEVYSPFYSPEQYGRRFEPIVELADFVNKCYSPNYDIKEDERSGAWLLSINREQKKIGLTVAGEQGTSLFPIFVKNGYDGGIVKPIICNNLVKVFPEYNFAALV